MRTARILRWAALAAVLSMTLPGSAEAQLGKFLKNKLKQKIAEKVVAEAVDAQAPADTVDSAAGTQTPGSVASAPRARKRAPGTAVKASIFSETTLEMTAELLDRFEKGVAAEKAERKAIAPQLARLLSNHDYDKCLHERVTALPAGQKAQREYLAAMQSGKTDAYQGAMEKYQADLERIGEPVCGLSPKKGEPVRRELEERPEKAALQASGLELYQFAILKERIIPFCALVGTPEAAGDFMRVRDHGASYVYTPGEVEALRPRCVRLAPALKG